MTADDKRDMTLSEPGDSSSGFRTTDLPLAECVRQALSHYFAQLDGYEVTNLHEMVLGEVEKPLIEAALERCGQNQSKAAHMLGLSRTTLRKKICAYGMNDHATPGPAATDAD